MKYTGLAVISCGVLAFQIYLMRLFSYAQWYHFAFFTISLALLGFGASGSVLYSLPGLLKVRSSKSLPITAVGFSISSILSILAFNFIPFDTYRIGLEWQQFIYLSLLYIGLSLPFFWAGMTLGISFSLFPEKAGSIYAANLAGSGLGCLAGLFLLPLGSKIVPIICWLGILSAIFLYPQKKLWLFVICVTGMSLTIILPAPSWLECHPSPYKSISQMLRSQNSTVLINHRGINSQVDLIKSPMIRYAPGLSLAWRSPLPEQLGILIDGENPTGVTRFSGERKELDFTDYLPTALPYHLLTPEDGRYVLLFNPRGGLEILNAMYHESRRITVVEDNPGVANLMRINLARYNGGLYQNPDIRLKVENIRTFAKQSQKKPAPLSKVDLAHKPLTIDRFDLVELCMDDSFGPVSAGAFSLSENYIYTVDAFQDYLNLLSEDGILLLTRWLQFPPSEEIRCAATIIEALEREGLDPAVNLVIYRTWRTCTFFVKRKPFGKEALNIIRNFCKDRFFDLIYMPEIKEEETKIYDIMPEPSHYRLIMKLFSSGERQKFYKEYPYQVRPTTDNRPYYFHFFKWRQLPAILENFGRQWMPFGGAGFLVAPLILIISIIISFLCIILPLLTRKSEIKRKQTLPFLFYFFSLGVGYLMIEIGLIHKFILFLGQPVYSFAIIISTLLTFSGIGSAISIKIKSRKGLISVLLFISGGILGFYFFLPWVVETFLPYSLSLRIVLTVLILMPLAILMGLPFPMGLKVLKDSFPQLIPWAWAVNGFASVVTSISAILLSLASGYSGVFLLAGFAYFASAVSIMWKK